MNQEFLRLEITTAKGTRIYAEFRPDGYGSGSFVGYLVDNGRDRRQVPTMNDAAALAEQWEDAEQERKT